LGSGTELADLVGLDGLDGLNGLVGLENLVDTAESEGGGDEDKEVLTRMQAGEGAALEELWRRYAGLLYTQALRVLHNPSEAEDVVVEVFSEAWKRSSSYHPERARPVAWLVTLVRRRAIDHLRERRSHERAEARLALDGAGAPQGAADGVHSEEMVRLAELRWLLDQALRRLPQSQRETVCMVYFDGLTQKEIAARTKTPLGTVKTRLELGMRKLRDRIRCTRLHSAGLSLGE
jgi:RNA polymerase sigma-70 factor (ECF subfamily)